MKLFVWNVPYPVDYGGSIIYAVAETVGQAREVAMKAPLSKYGYEPKSLNEGSNWPFKLGKPDRVLAVPCAEIYEWSE
jgi:hypothetical protein